MAAALQAEQAWSRAFPPKKDKKEKNEVKVKIRPQLYSSSIQDDYGFRPLNDPSIFSADLHELNSAQMYAVASNNALALQLAQEEYFEIARVLAAVKDNDKEVKDPRITLDKLAIEEIKEAGLYGQPYVPGKPARLENGRVSEHYGKTGKNTDLLSEQERRDVRLAYDPFLAFYPKTNDKPKKKGKDFVTDPVNPDGFSHYKIGGKEYVPIQSIEHLEYTAQYTKRPTDENGVPIRPVSPDPESLESSQRLLNGLSMPTFLNSIEPTLSNKRASRYNGTKVPATRDESEAPSGISTPKRKRYDTPLDAGTREGTPNKRLRVDHPSRTSASISTTPQSDLPKKKPHPNQYTKAREAREREAAIVAAAGPQIAPPPAPTVDFSSMTDEEKWQHKWTDADLIAAIKADHTWLGEKRDLWRPRLLNSANPVRSLSMLKKWRFWQDNGQDKRPRNKDRSENGVRSKEGTVSRGRTPATPAALGDEASVGTPVANGVYPETNGLSSKAFFHEGDKENSEEREFKEEVDLGRGGRPALSRRSSRRSARRGAL